MENICEGYLDIPVVGSTGSVIWRIIREIVLTLPRCLFFVYFHIAFVLCEVIVLKCDICILFL